MVELTREEERMLRGDMGEAVARAMEIIVRVAESLGASKLVKIKHAHISGVSYGTIGEPGAHLLEELAKAGARFRVPATVNPIGYDPEEPEGYGLLRITSDFVRGQSRILRALKSMGAELSLTCTPYYLEGFEKYGLRAGDSVAWGESSAVAYANTVLGIKTNREGGPLALMAAITGRTYYYGLHIDENRLPEVEYRLESETINEAVLGVLAEYLAENHESSRPPMVKLARRPVDYELREFAAALGAAGSIAMAVIPGITPLPSKPRPSKTVEVDRDTIERRLRELQPSQRPDLVFIGCPHASYKELTIIANALKEKSRIPILVTLSRSVYTRAKETGLVEALTRRGVMLLRGTCLIVSRPRRMTVATNSYKAYFYLSKKGLDVGLAPLKTLLELAARGGS